MTLRKREETGAWKNKQQTALSGEVVFEEAMDFSYDRLWDNDDKAQPRVIHCIRKLLNLAAKLAVTIHKGNKKTGNARRA